MIDQILSAYYGSLQTHLDGIKAGKVFRRPLPHEVEVHSFPQAWGSGCLGFGGIGGQAITTAQTTVIYCPGNGSACVYFGGRLAYVIRNPNRRFFEDLYARNMAEVSRRFKYGRPDSGESAS